MSAASYYGQPQSHFHQDNKLGGHSFNHGPSANAERTYDEYRDNARHAHDQHNFQQMDYWNKKASDFIFLENNAPGRVKENEIDLHGQFVKEAERILRDRITTAQAEHQQVLHVIVGKGNHSPHHIQKIKPAVETLCRDLNLREETEPNEGRIRIHLQGGGGGGGYSGGQQGYPGGQGGYQSHQQPHYGQQQQHHGKPQQQFESDEQKMAENLIRKCIKSCCTVM